MNGQTEKKNHAFSVTMRKEMRISGVQEVQSFDEQSVSLSTAGGEMTVEGSELRIGVLDTEQGVVTLSGRIDGVFYSGERVEEKRGLFGKLFR